ncbi:MAG: dTDP-4-dehydrorhamnose 3,5-epimerase [Acidobacteriota bacterium]
MKVIETEIPEVLIIESQAFRDERGFFFESYHRRKFAEMGIQDTFVQDNHAMSQRGILRGLHYQIKHPQAKLCRVIRGEVLDVAVDIRRGSPHFGKHVRLILSAENMRQIYIPAGFAHGYVVLSDTAEFLYKCSDFYYPEYDRGILWNDPELAIDWGITNPQTSEKDRRHLPLSRISAEDLPSY